MNHRARAVVLWVVAAGVLLGLAYQQKLFVSAEPASSGSTSAMALSGGGFSDVNKCGVKGFHHFPLPPDASSPPSPDTPQIGPQLALGTYGYQQMPDGHGNFTIQLLFSPGAKQSLILSRTAGTDGVAVEIEGPHGLAGGAHGLPVTWRHPSTANRDNTMHMDAASGGIAEVSLPVQALCPGYRGASVMKGLLAPIDSSNTITGQPPYTLTVSVSDPGIGELRKTVRSAVGGDLLSANNLVPLDKPIPRL
ncbi:hypothetical protein [Streptomyces aureus]|uniref:hypothetical protein n=1 Tax=Streptomyces aureus TaxID=193461 RepID=UPI00340B70E2